jgi:hypothetical protein
MRQPTAQAVLAALLLCAVFGAARANMIDDCDRETDTECVLKDCCRAPVSSALGRPLKGWDEAAER